MRNNQPVFDMLKQRLPVTLELALLAEVLDGDALEHFTRAIAWDDLTAHLRATADTRKQVYAKLWKPMGWPYGSVGRAGE